LRGVAEDRPLPNESQVEFLRRTEKLHELLLLAWDTIEFNIDQLVADSFGLHATENENSRVKWLLDRSFGKKLEFLRDIQRINPDDYAIIQAFQRKRNDLFHRDGWHAIFMMSQAEKQQLMDEAVKASTVSTHILFRKPS
jgi:hypothetical protein